MPHRGPSELAPYGDEASTMNRHPEYRLKLRAMPDDVPAVIRLRGLLKVALRSFGMRCVEVKEVKPPLDDQGDIAVSKSSADD